MTFILAQIRRTLLWGTVTFWAVCFCTEREYVGFLQAFQNRSCLQDQVFFVLTLALYLYPQFVFFSAYMIRHHGQFAAVHQRTSYFMNVIRCFGHDLISPFTITIKFIQSLFVKYPASVPEELILEGKSRCTTAFLWMLVCIMASVCTVLVMKYNLI